MPSISSTVLAAGAAVLAGLLSLRQPVFATDIATSDPASNIVDEEFDQGSAQFAWVDLAGNLWVGKVDPNTGAFVPPTGKGVLVDGTAAPLSGNGTTNVNGPEWAYSSAGAQLVYTRLDRTSGGLSLATAVQNGTTWTASAILEGDNRQGPIGSEDTNDTAPRIIYFDAGGFGNSAILWRDLYEPSTEGTVDSAGASGARWKPMSHSVVYTRSINNVQQVFEFDTDTGTVTQITFDKGDKSAVFSWQAPEFGNDYVLFAESGGSQFLIYRKTNGRWKKINAVKPPSTGKYLLSPQYFVYNGKSYIFTVTSTSTNPYANVPTDIWLVGIDPASPFSRKVSDETVKARRDPEVFITNQGPYIYFNAISRAGGAVIYRADTGLGSTP
ncbi:hypothetical protein [Gloeobacter kilaueensis]|uniref:Uncharacterized protein n=1 Tax=Gloeobacter kilaueensis (strain ATCC BAA-2537 / CCAP 1431/1 / ULC 316 / JS1) TaxID=1183438 RepID=U5QKI0_GLOK1|nr:hypothetical protein [Gloeobacter kilaueensis]AGY58129.1 hypothetical protein GKIL_1883 [Gloeobacter kilaueensis JS1]